MKKIVLSICLIFIVFSLFACESLKANENGDGAETEAKEKIDFPYCIEFEALSIKFLETWIMYDITVSKTGDLLELTVKYNDEEHRYYPEGFEELDLLDDDKTCIMKRKGKIYDMDGKSYDIEADDNKEILEFDLDYYEYTEKINLSKKQYEEMADIIAKIQSYDYDREKEQSRRSALYAVPPYIERVAFSVQNIETGEKNEIDCKYLFCEYDLILDENLKELIKKIVKLSPIPIVNYKGVPLEFKDECP